MNPFDCRAYDKLNKKIVEVISYDFVEGGLQVVEIGKESTKNNIYLLGPEEYILLSFTGKLDIDNKKIYLGDIVERTSITLFDDGEKDICVDVGEVIYNNFNCKFEIFCDIGRVSYRYYINFEDQVVENDYVETITYKRIKSKYE